VRKDFDRVQLVGADPGYFGQEVKVTSRWEAANNDHKN
jgi:hypothetical protein